MVASTFAAWGQEYKDYDLSQYRLPDITRNELDFSVNSEGDFTNYKIDSEEERTRYSNIGGNLDVMVGVGADGTCTGVSIISHAETSGLGANATKEDFRAQFVGKANVAVTKDGGDIAALTGATITSRAVCDGVNAAIEAAASVG